jgi:hypothetical protein
MNGDIFTALSSYNTMRTRGYLRRLQIIDYYIPDELGLGLIYLGNNNNNNCDTIIYNMGEYSYSIIFYNTNPIKYRHVGIYRYFNYITGSIYDINQNEIEMILLYKYILSIQCIARKYNKIILEQYIDNINIMIIISQYHHKIQLMIDNELVATYDWDRIWYHHYKQLIAIYKRMSKYHIALYPNRG